MTQVFFMKSNAQEDIRLIDTDTGKVVWKKAGGEKMMETWIANPRAYMSMLVDSGFHVTDNPKFNSKEVVDFAIREGLLVATI